MENLQLPHAKLLYQVSEMYKRDEINEEMKLIIKEKIIGDDQRIYTILTDFKETGNEAQLTESLINLSYEHQDENQLNILIPNTYSSKQEQNYNVHGFYDQHKKQQYNEQDSLLKRQEGDIDIIDELQSSPQSTMLQKRKAQLHAQGKRMSALQQAQIIRTKHVSQD